jgi:hypothetical protein
MGPKSKNRATSDDPVANEQPPADELATRCPDLERWPRSWMIEERDLSNGQQIVEYFKPFLRHLLSLKLSSKTFRKHRDNLWLLGGEVISSLHDTPRLRQRPIDEVMLAAVDADGGPLIAKGMSEEEQRSFDSTCRKLYRFLQPEP